MRKLTDEQIERVLHAAETKGVRWDSPYHCVAYYALGRPPRGLRPSRWRSLSWLDKLLDRRWHQISKATGRANYALGTVHNREEARTWLILSGLA